MVCSDQELSSITGLVGSAAASSICARYNVAAVGQANAISAWAVGEMLTQQQQLQAAQFELSQVAYGLDTFFLVINTSLVFMMQLGFAMFVGGVVRTKNISSILMKSFMDSIISGVCWYVVGYGFSHGLKSPTNAFIGNWDFALSGTTSQRPEHEWQMFVWTWAFCGASATIMAGAVA
eukprot:CAMPEP_0202879896 /NCGR_PEP_ID=MMETSP1391-20130828/34252_1 /ASSEMBLY_ACC=CAM_ASM_000867 /TAXON_ID=1034604 /ORGANISM="Chlamydomonas leiostraca, Strain SAG 11-49" /LENGTH=177 /DNA_ID=CAMNT_0049562309 /DNA_START=86 /DNA_END=616 /DNA_ORIENTATION=+